MGARKEQANRRTKARHDSGREEWYTPNPIIHCVNDFFGRIELDPFSCDFANQVVKAERYFTKKEDGLKQKWNSQKVFLNPPYKPGFVKSVVIKVKEELIDNPTMEVVLLTNYVYETNYFQPLMPHISAFCFIKGRVSFYLPSGETVTGNSNPSVLCYIGRNIQGFIDSFSSLGQVAINVPHQDQ